MLRNSARAHDVNVDPIDIGDRILDKETTTFAGVCQIESNPVNAFRESWNIGIRLLLPAFALREHILCGKLSGFIDKNVYSVGPPLLI